MEYEYLNPVTLPFAQKALELIDRLRSIDHSIKWDEKVDPQLQNKVSLAIQKQLNHFLNRKLKELKTKMRITEGAALSELVKERKLYLGRLESNRYTKRRSSPSNPWQKSRLDEARIEIQEWMLTCEAQGIDPHQLYDEVKHYTNERSVSNQDSFAADAGDENFAIQAMPFVDAH